MTVYDVVVIGAGPAGCQAAISAAHQMRHVLVLDGGQVSPRKGRAYWSKDVRMEDVPVFAGITGPQLKKQLVAWLSSRPVQDYLIGGQQRKTGIEYRGGVVLNVRRGDGDLFDIRTSVTPLREGGELAIESLFGRRVIIASGFEDRWPDIEVEGEAVRMHDRYRMVFRYAGNSRGWHVCIRCDGHLHVNEHLAIVGVGNPVYDITLGAQDFTDRMTLLTNGRPHGLSAAQIEKLVTRRIPVIEEKIVRHIGKKTELLGLQLADGREISFDGFLVDEGLDANTAFLQGWDYQTDHEGLLIVDDDRQMLDAAGHKIAGLYAAGDILSGERKLIAAAFASGQDAGLAASDSLRTWGF